MTSGISRRSFLAAAAGGTAAFLGSTASAKTPTLSPKTPMVHVTDLFRPHADPDDHWDLACVYALAAQGHAELLGVIIDHPPAGFKGDPDVLAVAQMNAITGLSVPVITGSPKRLEPEETLRPENRYAAKGATALLEILRRSPRPVIISVLGSSRDVALAGRLEPQLFRDKCAGIYLNAGSGTSDRALATRKEYNVALDPVSYAVIFSLPCRVYWLPCFEVAPGGQGDSLVAGPHGTYYRFMQKEVLTHLSRRVKNYFAFMFKQGETEVPHQDPTQAICPNWLRYLEGPAEEDLLSRQGEMPRNMWCTAGFFHSAGLAVTKDGEIVAEGGASFPLFTFDPVRVQCNPDGITSWSPDPQSRDSFLFHVRDAESYPSAMTKALRTLLGSLP